MIWWNLWMILKFLCLFVLSANPPSPIHRTILCLAMNAAATGRRAISFMSSTVKCVCLCLRVCVCMYSMCRNKQMPMHWRSKSRCSREPLAVRQYASRRDEKMTRKKKNSWNLSIRMHWSADVYYEYSIDMNAWYANQLNSNFVMRLFCAMYHRKRLYLKNAKIKWKPKPPAVGNSNILFAPID